MSDAPLIDPQRLDELHGILGGPARDALMRRLDDELASQPARIAALAARGDSGARQEAHALRGAALSVGAMRVAERAKTVEHAGADELAPAAAMLTDAAAATRTAIAALLD